MIYATTIRTVLEINLNAMFGYIYRTFIPRIMSFYVGQKKGEFNPRYLGSGTRVFREIRKHGRDGAFTVEICHASSQEELDQMEIDCIRSHREFGLPLINILDGGRGYREGYKQSKVVRDRITKSQMGLKRASRSRESIELTRAKNSGRKRTPEQRERIRLGCMGKKMSDQAKLNMRLARLGRKFSPLTLEHRAKIAESNRITKSLRSTKKVA